MRKIKLLLISILGILILSGCDLFKIDTMEDINIVTTSYPLEFILTSLYGNHSLVQSIYPDGVNINEYELNDKQLTNYSKERLFVYVSFGNDKDIAVKLLKKNKKLLIIDGSLGMKPDYIEELWLNPSNLLMVSQNIKNGLIEYISNNFLIKEIEKNYEDLKLKLSELDAEIKLTAENATFKTIVVATKSLNFLKKYGFNVISLDDDNNAIEKTIAEVNSMINNRTIKYIYNLEDKPYNETVKSLLNNNSNIEEIKLRKVDNISDEERTNKDDYFKIMRANIDLLKKETYK